MSFIGCAKSKTLDKGWEDCGQLIHTRTGDGKKYNAIETCVCPDGRVRGLLQFYGANRTGRFAGRLIQVQNLPRTYTDPIELARELVTAHDADALQCVYGSVNDTLRCSASRSK